ncbi:MAG: carbohydrate kinase [Sphaerochaetaceae bacterium]|nr:carbohydrate kinase [Sphaerochaetaceae bacterium]
MSNTVERYVGFDCGNSSVRTVVGTFDGSRITTEVIHQVPNRELRGVTYDHWDILTIFHEMLTGMKLACDTYEDIHSFGISTWGIDFGFLGKSGDLLGNPLCYRNPLGGQGLESRTAEESVRMFDDTGILSLPMNSIFQLLGIREQLQEYYESAETLLLIPDLLNYLFTGEKNSELSIASTTQTVDMRTRAYSEKIFESTGIRSDLFVPFVSHTQPRGLIRKEIAELYRIPRLTAISVPSHDTAAAVVTVPARSENFAFISSGTWSLIGTELPEPLINDRVREAGFSNEGGVFDTITLLKNSCGMHILQNIKREMEFTGNRRYSWDEIVSLSAPVLKSEDVVTYDPNSELLYHPDSMIEAVKSLTGLTDIAHVLASSYRSLAQSYHKAIDDLEAITCTTYDTVHIIGGGSRNDHLNQMTADLTGKRVTSGPEEATSLGVIAVQLMHYHREFTLKDLRNIIRESVTIREFLPKEEHV